MADRFSYREIRAMEREYCRQNDNIVGFFGGTDERSPERPSNGDD
ncbi:hypothetical protein [Halomicrobium katesii]|nr:hypothetical protein [Halomicrobium katesii]